MFSSLVQQLCSLIAGFAGPLSSVVTAVCDPIVNLLKGFGL